MIKNTLDILALDHPLNHQENREIDHQVAFHPAYQAFDSYHSFFGHLDASLVVVDILASSKNILWYPIPDKYKFMYLWWPLAVHLWKILRLSGHTRI